MRLAPAKVGVKTNAHGISWLSKRFVHTLANQNSVSVLSYKTLAYLLNVLSGHIVGIIFSKRRAALVLDGLLIYSRRRNYLIVVSVRALLTLH